MKLLRILQARFRKDKLDAEMAEEMRAHLELQAAENEKRGMSADEARYAARRKFGGVEQIKERARDQRGGIWLEQSRQDLRYAARQLRRNPLFTFVAVVTLALGIGVNAVMFSLVRDTVLRPLLRDQRMHLVSLYNSREGGKPDFRLFSLAEFEALRAPSQVFSEVAAIYFGFEAVGRPDDLRRRLIGVVSENYFSVLGVQPWRGRFFTADESHPDAALPVVVANFAFWDRLGRPENFLGSTIRVNQRDYTVVGIAPAGFGGLHVSIGPDVWLPLGEASQIAGRPGFLAKGAPLTLVASLQPELSLDAARTRLAPLDACINVSAPLAGDGHRRLVITPPSRTDLGNASPSEEGFLPLFASLAMGLAVVVLIVACLNLANMLLARGAARQKEIAIRLSLGASRWRVVRQLLVEGLLLALLGGALALFLSFWANELLFRLSSEAFSTGNFALNAHSFVDAPLLAATVGFCVVAALASSLGPALRLTRLDLVRDLKQLSGDSAAPGRWNRFFSLSHCLLMGQIALSLTLLFSSALFVRGSWRASTIDLGFQTGGQVVANLDYRLPNYPAPEIAQRQMALLARAASLPGVASAALASNIPYNFELPFEGVFAADGAGASAAKDGSRPRRSAGSTVVTRGYFATLGITLLRGRDFSEAESSGRDGTRVVIIDETLAQALFDGADALGRRVFIGDAEARKGDVTRACEVIGIVRSARNEVFASGPPRRFYRPLGQAPMANTYLHLRTSAPAAVLGMLRHELQTLDPATPILFARPLAVFVEKNINTMLVKLLAMVFGVFGGIALVLAVVGVYGVKAHAVARRTREIGIRVALGARPADVVALIVRQGVLQTFVGLGLGLTLALIVGQILAHMLYQVSPADPVSLAASSLVLGVAALLACWMPARRATKVDPMVALRTE